MQCAICLVGFYNLLVPTGAAAAKAAKARGAAMVVNFMVGMSS